MTSMRQLEARLARLEAAARMRERNRSRFDQDEPLDEDDPLDRLLAYWGLKRDQVGVEPEATAAPQPDEKDPIEELIKYWSAKKEAEAQASREVPPAQPESVVNPDDEPQPGRLVSSSGDRVDGTPAEVRSTLLKWRQIIAMICEQAKDIPLRDRNLFRDDCEKFLRSPWAKRAAALGWDHTDLFGYEDRGGLMHLSYQGLLWRVRGGTIKEMFTEFATVVQVGGKEITVNRRPATTESVMPLTLP